MSIPGIRSTKRKKLNKVGFRSKSSAIKNNKRAKGRKRIS